MYSTKAPGRVELLGNHTDYNEGLVLSLAINKHTTIEATPLPGGKIRLRSLDLLKTWSGNLAEIRPQTEETWVNYVLGIFSELQKRGAHLDGAELKIASTIPIGAGLSSSAALEMATALALKKLYPYDLPTLEIARVGQGAEHHYANVLCGLLDQISVLMGRAGHATFIDCRSFSVQHLPLDPNTVFVIVHSGVNHALAAGEYNERRESCEEAARLLGKKTLRDVTRSELEKMRHSLPETVFHRALHIVGENERVTHAVGFLAYGDMEALGRLMFQSHQSSRTNFENSCRELDILVELAQMHPACLGARLSGGGFGGATINLIRREQAENFKEAIRESYLSYSGIVPLVLETEACDGAG